MFILKIGALAFVPLFYIEIVILPLFFLLCEFTPMISKRSTSLPLLRHPPITVLNFVQKDINAHAILPLFVMPNYDFTLIWN